MINRLSISVILAVAGAAALTVPVFAGGFGAPSSGDPEIVLAGGMGGGAGGMGGGAGGMGGSAGGMRGGNLGGTGTDNFGDSQFGGPMSDFGQAARGSSGAGTALDNYTYQCVTSAERCSFVAPAWLRAGSLRSGADCVCGNGPEKGRVE
jgi:hypothetical protein